MSIEENGHANGGMEEVSAGHDSTAEHSFDDLARGAATGTVPRRKALRMLAASLFGGLFVAAPAALAVAAPKPGGTGCSVAGQTRQNGKCVCPQGKTVCGTGDNRQCVNNQCGSGSNFNSTTCQCDAVNQCASNEVLCEGRCVNECAGGLVRDPVSCECVCPSDPCPAEGQTRNANCQCVCGADEVVCGGACMAECAEGQFRNPTTCECVVACNTPGTVLCGEQCVQECTGGQIRLDNCMCGCPEEACSVTGQTRNPQSCACECPETQPLVCGGQCRAECGAGQLRDPATCTCVAACAAANCEGCCGTTTSGSAICRAGTTTQNCGSGGATCATCGTGRNCAQANGAPIGTRSCCINSSSSSAPTCTSNAQCCVGRRCSGSRCIVIDD